MNTLNKIVFGGSIALAALAAMNAQAATQYHRVVWDGSPSSSAVIGFSPNGSSSSPYIKFGQTLDESQWQTKTVSKTEVFGGSLQTHFVRLTNLSANSPVYYQVCDQQGCGQRLWFKTAPVDNSQYLYVAGGDTRTGHTTRRQGNALIAKLRPLFIMHGGDFTNSNNASEMSQFLSDWQLTLSSDSFNGKSYKRIYPLIPTHGNHEDNNYKTLCQVFGVDYNQDNSCSNSDTYGAFNISPLLRVYTLNSQFHNSGYSSYASAQNAFLQNDLASQGQSVSWRTAQYHKPMFPHYSGKSDNVTLYNWWADDFKQYAMNLVVESDTHINKMTKPVVPSNNGEYFAATTSGGTVFIGEGSWGAPARSANDDKSWTQDMSAIQQFKVISVSSSQLKVRTAQFDGNASSLSQSQRDANPVALPSGVNWWSANGIGSELVLNRASNKLSVVAGQTPPTSTPTVAPTFVPTATPTPTPIPTGKVALQNGVSQTNISGAKGDEVRFYLDNIPSNATNLSVVMSSGSGDADLYVKANSEPSSSSYDCRPYKNGNNESCELSNAPARVEIMLRGYSAFSGVSLKASYQTSSTPPNNTGLNESKTGLAASKGQWVYFTFTVPAGMSSVQFNTLGGSGDADLYVQQGSQPSKSQYQCRPYKSGNVETCSFNSPTAGQWFVGLYAYSNFSAVTLTAVAE